MQTGVSSDGGIEVASRDDHAIVRGDFIAQNVSDNDISTMIENYLHRREGGQFVPVEIYLYYCTWIIRSAKPTFIIHDGEISLK